MRTGRECSAPRSAEAVRPATQEPVSTFTLDGFVAGTWRIERETPRAAATLTLRPIRPLSRRETTALADEGAALLAFLAAESTDHRIRCRRRDEDARHRVATERLLPAETGSCHNPATMTRVTLRCACPCRPSAMQGRWCI